MGVNQEALVELVSSGFEIRCGSVQLFRSHNGCVHYTVQVHLPNAEHCQVFQKPQQAVMAFIVECQTLQLLAAPSVTS